MTSTDLVEPVGVSLLGPFETYSDPAAEGFGVKREYVIRLEVAVKFWANQETLKRAQHNAEILMVHRLHRDTLSGVQPSMTKAEVMKVATQFKQYSQNMTYYLTRNAYQIVKGEDAQTRKEARAQLAGTLGVTAISYMAKRTPLLLVPTLKSLFLKPESSVMKLKAW